MHSLTVNREISVFMDTTWVGEMYITNDKHQIEIYMLNVSIKIYYLNNYNTYYNFKYTTSFEKG